MLGEVVGAGDFVEGQVVRVAPETELRISVLIFSDREGIAVERAGRIRAGGYRDALQTAVPVHLRQHPAVGELVVEDNRVDLADGFVDGQTPGGEARPEVGVGERSERHGSVLRVDRGHEIDHRDPVIGSYVAHRIRRGAPLGPRRGGAIVSRRALESDRRVGRQRFPASGLAQRISGDRRPPILSEVAFADSRVVEARDLVRRVDRFHLGVAQGRDHLAQRAGYVVRDGLGDSRLPSLGVALRRQCQGARHGQGCHQCDAESTHASSHDLHSLLGLRAYTVEIAMLQAKRLGRLAYHWRARVERRFWQVHRLVAVRGYQPLRTAVLSSASKDSL